MKILVCSTGFLPAESFGGLPFSTFFLCRGLAEGGADVRVVTTNCNGATPLAVETDCWTTYDGLPVWYATTRGGPFLYAPTAAVPIAEVMPKVDCVINSATLWSHSGVLSWRAAHRSQVPSLTYVRGLLDPWAMHYKPYRKKAYWHLVGKRILRDSTVIVALTEYERQIVRGLKVPTRVEVIPNGAALDARAESAPRADLEARIPELAGRRYVLFLGRIHEKKGIDILLRAIVDFQAGSPDVAFVLAGPIDPSFAARWHDLRGRYLTEERVITPGAVKEPLKTLLLKHAELFVLPSYSEGLPVAVLEALLSGSPVVVTKQCNLPEVQSADAGIVIDPDAGQLLTAMRTILRDGERRRTMAENAAKLARETFRWDAIAERTLLLCREIMTSRHRLPLA